MTDAPPARPPIVWFVGYDAPVAPAALTALASVLSDVERSKATGLLTADARQQAILARATLRHLLSAVAPAAAADWTFTAGPHGKPLVSGMAAGPLHVSVAHTHGLVAGAVSTHGRVGVDVEHVGRFARNGGPTPLLSPDERAELAALAPADRARRMAELWTAKEAYAKAVGLGVHDALRQITVRNAAVRPVLSGPVAGLDRWHLHRIDSGPHHVAVLAAESPQPPVVVHKVVGDLLHQTDVAVAADRPK